MSEDSAIRIERIKRILGLETDSDLAEFCGRHQPLISKWCNKGFIEPIERLLDVILDKYDEDKRPRIGRPPKLSIGQHIRLVRKDQRLSQRDLAERMYGTEGFSENALRMRGSRLENLRPSMMIPWSGWPKPWGSLKRRFNRQMLRGEQWMSNS